MLYIKPNFKRDEVRERMNYKQKIKLMKYLNLDGEVGRFLCGDLFAEFAKLIPLKICFSKANLDPVIREINKRELVNVVSDFLSENKSYSDVVKSYFKEYDATDLYEHLLTGYIFYSSLSSEKYCDIDIFENPLSVLCPQTSNPIDTIMV